MKPESGASNNVSSFEKDTQIFKLTVNDDINKWYIEFTSQNSGRKAYQQGVGETSKLGMI